MWTAVEPNGSTLARPSQSFLNINASLTKPDRRRHRRRHAPCSLGVIARKIRHRCPEQGHTRRRTRTGAGQRRHETLIDSRIVRLLEPAARHKAGAGAQRDRAGRHSPRAGRHLHAQLRSPRRASVPDRRHPGVCRLRSRAQGRGVHRGLGAREPGPHPRAHHHRGNRDGRRGRGRIGTQLRRGTRSSSSCCCFRSPTGAAPARGCWAGWSPPRSRIGSVRKRSGSSISGSPAIWAR